MKKLIITLSTLAIMAISPLASAEDVSLHMSGGALEYLHAPWSAPQDVFTKSQFNTGGTAEGSVLFNLVPNFAIGPDVAVEYLPQSKLNSEAAVLWNMGAAARLQGNRNADAVPYVNVAGFVTKQADIYNPGMSATAGIEWALESTHTLAAGPFIGWSHSFQSHANPDWQTLPMDHHDLNVATVGLSISFDGPVKQKVVVETQTVTNTVTLEHTTFVPVTTTVVAPPTVVSAPAPLQLDQKVQFLLGSSTLDATATATLDSVVAAMKATPGYHVVVEGKASSDGTANKNLVLSHARAVSVVSYLSKHGVSLTDVSVEAVGGVGTPGDVSNREVDFLVLTLVRN